MVKRELLSVLKARAAQFKAVLLTGPRQSGKTTLARAAFPQKPYVSLENPDERLAAAADPRSFLARFPEGAVTFELADFTLLRLDFESGLYVAGFGRAIALPPDDIARLSERV